jgi:GNAT superfamily N-acetyltransferase
MGELGYPTTYPEMRQRLLIILPDPSYKTLVYDNCGKIIAMIGMVLNYAYELNESYVRIVALVVSSEHRNRGIGSALLLEAEKWAKERGASVLALNSGNRDERSSAHQFYINRGFQGKSTGFIKFLD